MKLNKIISITGLQICDVTGKHQWKTNKDAIKEEKRRSQTKNSTAGAVKVDFSIVSFLLIFTEQLHIAMLSYGNIAQNAV